jgi:hypothetical protein
MLAPHIHTYTYVHSPVYCYSCARTAHSTQQTVLHYTRAWTAESTTHVRTWTADSTTHVAWTADSTTHVHGQQTVLHMHVHGMDSRQYYTRTWTADSTTHVHGQQTVLHTHMDSRQYCA